MEQWNGLPRIIDLPEDYVEALMEESEALEEIMRYFGRLQGTIIE